MKLEEFRYLSREYVHHDTYLNFRDVLELSYFSGLGFDDDRIIEAYESSERVPKSLQWLEIRFFLDMENGGEMEFYGILPMTLDMMGEGEPDQAEKITFGEPAGKVQPFDWEAIMMACEIFNDGLEERCGIPVVRVSYDDQRRSALYYTLTQFNYREMRVKVGAERIEGGLENSYH